MTPESVPPVLPAAFPGAGDGADSPGNPAIPLEQWRGGEGSAAEPAPAPGKLDGLFAVLVLALAFLLASTPARNSDLWLHLASGRALLRGQVPHGTDPFASTTTGIAWVNHAWLTDVILYELHTLGNGRALVVAKGVLVALLAGLLFCF